MDKPKDWAVVIFSILLLLSHSGADFTLEVEFHSYQNPTHAAFEFDGACCDHSSISPPNCTNNCDNYFLICLKDTGVDNTGPYSAALDTSQANDSCPYGWILTDRLATRNRDNLEFTVGSLDESGLTPNPVLLESSYPWPGVAELVILVVDIDGSTADDRVDIVSVVVTTTTLQALPKVTSISNYTGLEGYSHIQLNYTLSCTKDFYGLDCTTFCVPRNDTHGHYTCNKTSGMIICSKGYINTSTLCTQCLPSEGCSPIGGFCEVPGDCICRDGFHGDNCTETDQPTTTTAGGSLAPAIGGAVTAIVLLVIIGTAIAVAGFAEMKRKQKCKNNPGHRRRPRNSEMLSNAAYVKTTAHVQGHKRHEEFETSQNPGYRALSLARQMEAAISSSYPGAHNINSRLQPPPPVPDDQREDLYYYSYTSVHTVQARLNMLSNHTAGVYSLEGPSHSEEAEVKEGHRGHAEQNSHSEDEYVYVSTEHGRHEVGTRADSVKNGQIQKKPVYINNNFKPVPLPRAKKTSQC